MRRITRRDFLNTTLIGMGAALLELPAPLHLFAQEQSWDGYGGVGDYANSHGNMQDVVLNAHKIRDGHYDKIAKGVIDTGEAFDLVIIGGGLSGLGCALSFKKDNRRGQKCLILENHPIFGGEAKRNEFRVNGHKLIGPQGSNSFSVINRQGAGSYEIYSELGIPTRFDYQELSSPGEKLHFDRTNFAFMLWYDNAPNIGYFMPDQNDENKAKWHLDIWSRRLEHIPFARNAKHDFHTWRNVQKRYYDGEDIERWLDSMTYKTYLEKVMGLNHGITKFVDPVLASSMGLGADAISAFGAYQSAMPGFQGFPKGFKRKGRDTESEWHSFPGGNDGFVRYFVKRLVPTAIQGADNFEGIMNGRVNFGALDQPDNRIAIRLDSLVVRIEHDAESDKADYVWVTYLKKGKIFRIRARSVVAASGSFMSRRIVKDLPADYADAYKSFFFSPVLVVNVAVTNWKFLDKLGITACRWFKGFGFSCNIRRPMVIGDYQPPLAPNKPAIITFYVPFYYPGLPVKDQGKKGRLDLLSTSYRTYELKIKDQMAELFGKTGFNPDKDIAGIVLNRWGHAYVNPAPGFYFGKDGQSAPREIIRKRFGRIAFAHSELNGHQHWAGAVAEGQRAAKQIMDVL